MDGFLLTLTALLGLATSSFDEGDKVRFINKGACNAYLCGTIVNVTRAKFGTTYREFCDVRLPDGQVIKELSESLRDFDIKMMIWTQSYDFDDDLTKPFPVGSTIRVAHSASIWNRRVGIIKFYTFQGSRRMVMVHLKLPDDECFKTGFNVLLFPRMLVAA